MQINTVLESDLAIKSDFLFFLFLLDLWCHFTTFRFPFRPQIKRSTITSAGS